MRSTEELYRKALADIPPPGENLHSHDAIFHAACCGVEAGRSDEEIFSDIRAAIPRGKKTISDSKIRETIRNARKHTAPKAFHSGSSQSFRAPPPPKTEAEKFAEDLQNDAIAEMVRRYYLEAGGGEVDPFSVELWKASPIRIVARSEAFRFSGDMLPLLEHLYKPEDLVFIGKQTDNGEGHIKPAAEWREFFLAKLKEIENCNPARQQRLFDRLGEQYPLIMPNPLTGNPAPTKGQDKTTLRGDACVKEFRYIVAECDNLSLHKQGALLRGLCRLGVFRIAALIYSGGKSLHAWLCCNGVHSLEEWQNVVKRECFALLKALGFDDACSPPSHMSRLPGMFRKDKDKDNGNWQQLLYLAPKGGDLQ